jgi:hypothetical protein
MDTTELENTIRETTIDAITEALEGDGNPVKVAEQLRSAIRRTWKLALENTGMPPHQVIRLQFPL